MSGGRRDCAILTLAFLLTLPALTARFYASDEIQYFAWLDRAVIEFRRLREVGCVERVVFSEDDVRRHQG